MLHVVVRHEGERVRLSIVALKLNLFLIVTGPVDYGFDFLDHFDVFWTRFVKAEDVLARQLDAFDVEICQVLGKLLKLGLLVLQLFLDKHEVFKVLDELHLLKKVFFTG
jgi:hypothetical protein